MTEHMLVALLLFLVVVVALGCAGGDPPRRGGGGTFLCALCVSGCAQLPPAEGPCAVAWATALDAELALCTADAHSLAESTACRLVVEQRHAERTRAQP